MKIQTLPDRIRVTETNADDAHLYGAIPSGVWNKRMFCWDYPRSPFTAFRLGKLVERDHRAYGDRPFVDLLHGMERIVSASKWKQSTAAAVADQVAAHINGFHTTTKPWRHQLMANAFANEMDACYLALDMGTGKTLVAINQILEHDARNTLILCPKSVLDVWLDEFKRHVDPSTMPRICALTKGTTHDKAEVLAWETSLAKATNERLVALVNYDSAWRGDLGEAILNRGWDLVIADECVPPGTMIATPSGQRPIEEIQAGDIVLGVLGDQIVATSVLHTWDRDTMAPLIEVGPAKLTEAHPIWTKRGYVDASEMVPSDHVRVLREDRAQGPQFEEVLLEELQNEVNVGGPTGTQGGDSSEDAIVAPRPNGAGENPGASRGANEPVPRSSGEPAGSAGSSSHWVQPSQRREWEGHRPATAETVLYVGGRLVTGVRFENWSERSPATPLQDRHRQPGSEDSDRGGWDRSSGEEGHGSGQTEGSVSSESGVDGDPSSERTCHPRSRVLNLETVTGNYFANGLLVHNCHRLKSPSGRAAKWASKLYKVAKRRLLMSGTPIPNNILDVWAQFRLLDPGVFGTNYMRFRARYAQMGGYGGYEVQQWINQDELKRLLDLVTFRVDVSVLDLPSTMSTSRYCELDDDAARIYRDLEKRFVADVVDGTVTAANALTRLLRLQQVTSGYVTTEEHVESPVGTHKADLLHEVLEGIDPHERVVVFCRFRHDLEVVRATAEKLGRIHGELSGSQNDLIGGRIPDGINTLGVQIQAGGLGVNLIAARYCIFYSVGFSLADYEQAKARLHRGGQTQHVNYIHLIARGTVDEKVYSALDAKREVVEAIMEYCKRGDA